MAQSPDHPELAFVQARYYQKGRPSGAPLWIIAHTMEAGESSTRAENTAAYFANPGDGRVVSSHYCADNNSIVCCVKLADTAFTVGNIGNQRGINWEFSGFAAQTGAQWGDVFSMAMLERSAPYWALDAARFRIPIERRTVTELRAMRPGLTTHNDLRLAFGGTTHTDPGANFPWPQFIDMIGGATVALEQELNDYVLKYLPESGNTSPAQRRIRSAWRGLITGTSDAAPVENRLDSIDTKLADMETKLNAIALALASDPPGGVQNVTLNGTLSGTVSGTISGSAGIVPTEPVE